jgi:AcrR family transcriptional regulator
MIQVNASEKTDNTIDRILATALEHFSKYGYLGASVREITSAAGVTKPTLYYYFQNKEDLYRVLASSSFEKMREVFGQTQNTPGTLTSNFCSLVKSFYEFAETNLPVARFIQVLSYTPGRDVPDVGIREFKAFIDLTVEQMVTLAMKNSEIPEGAHDRVYLLLLGLLTLAAERRLSGSAIPIEVINKTVEALVVK